MSRTATQWAIYGLSVMLLLALAAAVLSPKIDLLARGLSVPDELHSADVIVAFSSGKLQDCKAHPNLFLREAYAARLLKQGFSRSNRLLVSGIYTNPNKVDLAQCRAQLANVFGIEPEQLIIDNAAFTTLDNAVNTKRIMDEHGWKDALLVTSRSHMFRALHVLRHQGVKTWHAASRDRPREDEAAPWYSPVRLSLVKRFLYEYGALVKYKCYGYW